MHRQYNLEDYSFALPQSESSLPFLEYFGWYSIIVLNITISGIILQKNCRHGFYLPPVMQAKRGASCYGQCGSLYWV